MSQQHTDIKIQGDDYEDADEEEEEEEPRLKYQRMGGSVPSLLSNDAATCLAVAQRMIALGTRNGSIHILDFLGNQVKEFPAHTAAVNDLCFDVEGEYIGSCSDDGSVIITSLFTEEKLKFDYYRPMKAIAVDPYYAKRSSRRFVAGGLAGHLYINTKNWIGYRDQVLHSGEGPIHAVKWRTNLIAWANDAGVKVYDSANNQRITFIERPRGSPFPEILLPHLVWQDDSLLAYNLLYEQAYIPGEEDREKEFSDSVPLRQANAQRPEVRVVTWNNEELATDALPVHGFEHYKTKDYSLVHSPFSGSSFAGGQWAAGDEPLYYIVSPKDVVIAKPRDAEDHISWLLEHGCHEKALAAIETVKGRSELIDEVGSRYLDHLIVERKYADVASLCPKLLRGSTSAWERWVFHFAHLKQLPVLVPYIPTENPRLRDTAYEVALVALATTPAFHKDLLSTIKSWPPVIYSVMPVIAVIEPQLNSSSMTDALKEALAELYVIDAQYEKAVALYAELMKPNVFDFIEKHNLHDVVREKVVQLMTIDSAKNNCDSRYFLHMYLHSLFEANPHAGKEFHDMQVELYADYDPKMLLPFFRSSQHYKLEKAHEICLRRDLLREQVFILGRMGYAKKALSVIINKLGDVEEAVDFVSMQHDDELWDELIRQCLQKPEMVGMLLDHTVGNIDPLYIVNMVPNGLEIPRLRDHLVKIITDYRTETSLRHGCNDILKADIINLLIKYYKEARRAIYLSNEEDEVRAKRNDSNGSQFTERSLSMKNMEVKSKVRAGGRCCVCFDPFSLQNVSIVVFYCCHAYHLTCLVESANSVNDNKKSKATSQEVVSYYESDHSDAGESDNDNTSSGAPQMRCILCTTAAGWV
ncbi:Vacuolar protein sorting-associated protein 41-like [Heracleum sosnowskyi]|uniref:Vacuolar protein sorting-associated protein 41 homolog n=1 Tax=Heracleum sosnowskyi TaxID=360622 RepID=A0AAD8IC86_9APIA|nr:Vacuolar protein sorting-associated protein 41-like [Heracleum sosnowskyi]